MSLAERGAIDPWTDACFCSVRSTQEHEGSQASMDAGDETVGRYVLHGEIASGGMARVHFGSLRGATGFSRLVAIKQLHSQLAREPHVRAMFIDEARLAARVHHPNVVATLDVVSQGDELLLIMEYVHGESLRALARTMRQRHEPIPLRILLSVMTNVLHGLHAVHEAIAEDGTPLDIVHRDVSPSNIMVGIDGAARLLDFGIAHAARRIESTRTGTLKGKLAYMAPEQFSGAMVTRQTDIFAAGVVLWELLAGRRLFLRGEDGDSVLIDKILHGTIETPSAHAPSLSPLLDTISLTALARDPRDRFQTARAMAVSLEHAGELATMSEVADWVRVTASEALAARAAVVRRIERDSANLRAASIQEKTIEVSARDILAESAPTSVPMPGHASDPHADEKHLTPSLVAIPRSEPPPDEVPMRSWARRGLAIGALTGVAVVALLMIVTRTLTPGASSSRAAVVAVARVAAAPPRPPCPDTMRPVPGGKFFMGSDDDLPIERPAHPVTLSAYCIDTFEVTTADYKACSDHGECKRAGTTNRWQSITDEERAVYDPLCNTREPSARAKHPVNCVTHDMADIFCRSKGKRLPTEAEWEFAARGSDGRTYPWGDDEPSPLLLNACGSECLKWARRAHVFDLHAMYAGDDGWPTTAPVGSFPKGASPFGVEDVVGNVWEWVGDWFSEYPSAEQIDPRGPAAGDERVIRGGAWNGSFTSWVRPTFRYKDTPDKRSYGIGFRCAKPQ
jgi:formylglycine-generating enzyme required for sulfatase activity